MKKLGLKIYDFLRWSEKYTKTDMVYLFEGGSWYGLGTFFSYSIALVSVVAFANLLPKETYGTYQYILSIVDLFGIFVLVGINTSLTRSVAQGKEGAIFEALSTQIKWGLLGGIGAIILGTYYLSQGNQILGIAFVIAGFVIPFWEAPGIYVTYLQGKKIFKLLNWYSVCEQFLATIVVVSTLFFTKNILVILPVYFVSWGIARLFFFTVTIKKFPPNNERDPEMVNYGKHLTIMQAASSVSMSVDKALLWHFLGPVTVATYVFAQAIPLRAAGIMKIINRLAYPKMANQDLATLKQTLPKKIVPIFLLGLLFTLAYVILAPFIFSLLFPKYMEAVPFTQITAILIALQPFSLFSSALSAQAKKKSLYLFNFGNPIMRIILFSVLIPFWGLIGAVWALVFSKIAENILLAKIFYSSQ